MHSDTHAEPHHTARTAEDLLEALADALETAKDLCAAAGARQRGLEIATLCDEASELSRALQRLHEGLISES